jgi:hypothetical protein
MTLDLLMSSINFGDTSPRVANSRKRKTFGTGFRGQGVFLCYSGHTNWYRIYSKADFDKNHSVLIQQGWILGGKDN